MVRRRAHTRRPPHVRAESPETAQQNHLAVTTAVARSDASGALGSSRAGPTQALSRTGRGDPLLGTEAGLAAYRAAQRYGRVAGMRP